MQVTIIGINRPQLSATTENALIKKKTGANTEAIINSSARSGLRAVAAAYLSDSPNNRSALCQMPDKYNIHIDDRTGYVSLDKKLIASSLFNVAQIEAMGKSMMFSKAAKKSRLYFRREHDLTWESLNVDAFTIQCHHQKCVGCVINLNPIASCNTPESLFTLVTSQMNVAPSHIEITGNTSRTYRFDWGTIDFIYDPHYAAISIDLTYKF